MTSARTLHRRPAADRIPQHTEQAALAAATRIHRRRAAATDPDLDFYPTPVVDADDLDAVVTYLDRHRRVRDKVRRAELPDRAVIIEYLRQRETVRYELRVLAVLEAGLELGAAPATVGGPFGLLSRQHVWNRRRDLRIRHREGGETPATRRETAQADRLDTWLTTHATELRAAAGLLVDHHDTLLPLLRDPAERSQLAEAITQAGQSLGTRRPTATLAAAVAYALYFLHPDNGPAARHPDPVVRDGLAAAARLRDSYRAMGGSS